jgi:hypothetical protein
MSAPVFILIAIAFTNGNPVQTEAGLLYKDLGSCTAAAKESSLEAEKHDSDDIQVVYKCVDISQVPNVANVFGHAKTL